MNLAVASSQSNVSHAIALHRTQPFTVAYVKTVLMAPDVPVVLLCWRELDIVFTLARLIVKAANIVLRAYRDAIAPFHREPDPVRRNGVVARDGILGCGLVPKDLDLVV